jgi:hypothetical protein
MSIHLSPLKEKELQMIVKGFTFYISGSVNLSNPSELMGPYILKLHNKAVESGIKKITLDITNLSFLNSSGIREIVNWILLLNNMPEEKKYAIHIKYNSRHQWQESSISTFVCLNPDLVTKEVT